MQKPHSRMPPKVPNFIFTFEINITKSDSAFVTYVATKWKAKPFIQFTESL